MNAKRFFYVMAVVLALSLLSIVGSYVWGKSQLEEKSTTLANKKAALDVSQEAIVKLQNGKVDDANIQSLEALLDRLLPTTKEQDKLIADIIYTSTAEAGIPFIKVTNFSFSGGEEPNDLSGTIVSTGNPGVNEYPFNMSITEISYGTLLGLLRQIETNGRIIQIDSIQIVPKSTSQNVDINLSMKAYVKP